MTAPNIKLRPDYPPDMTEEWWRMADQARHYHCQKFNGHRFSASFVCDQCGLTRERIEVAMGFLRDSLPAVGGE